MYKRQPLRTVYNWLDIAKYNPDAPDVLKKFFEDFQEAKIEGRKQRKKMDKLGKLQLKLDTEDIVDIKNITGFSGIIEARLTQNYSKFAKEQELADSSDEQDDNEDQDSWVDEVESGIIEYGKDDNSLQKESEDS